MRGTHSMRVSARRTRHWVSRSRARDNKSRSRNRGRDRWFASANTQKSNEPIDSRKWAVNGWCFESLLPSVTSAPEDREASRRLSKLSLYIRPKFRGRCHLSRNTCAVKSTTEFTRIAKSWHSRSRGRERESRSLRSLHLKAVERRYSLTHS